MNDRRSALVTGITGQDGSYLAELLLGKGYEVHGMVRRASTEKFDRIEQLRDRITLHQGDLLDQRSLVDALRASRPTEIYNLAAMSFVAVSWIQPTLTAEFSGVGAAFDFHAGLVSQAPPWMQRNGLEWTYRLSHEPRRLWRRYARYNPRFVAGFARQYLAYRRRRAR